jgi:hypothetical protein
LPEGDISQGIGVSRFFPGIAIIIFPTITGILTDRFASYIYGFLIVGILHGIMSFLFVTVH